jgi:hypothetical protein
VWSALHYSVKAAESDLRDCVVVQKTLTDQLEADGIARSKEMAEWKLNVSQAFQDVDHILGRQVDELAKGQRALEDKLRAGKGGGGPRIQDGFLFPRPA